jgi:hypothetical protein
MARVPYLGPTGGSSGRVPYLGPSGGSSARTPYLGSTPAKPSGGGGLFGGITHFIGRTASDLESAAINTIPGTYKLAKDVVGTGSVSKGLSSAAQSWADLLTKGQLHYAPNDPLKQDVRGIVQSTKETVEHPLRHPGYTALFVLPALSGAAKFGIASAEGATGAEAGSFATRSLSRGGLTVHPEASRTGLGQVLTKGSDVALQRATAARPGGRAEALLNRRIGKTLTAEARQTERAAKAEPSALIRLGHRLKPGEQKALQVVAEQTPLEQAITTAAARVVGAKTAISRAGHQADLNALHAAREHLTTDPAGRPQLAEPRLQKVYDKMANVAGDRETLMKGLGMLTEQAKQSRVSKAGRVTLGQDIATGPFEAGPGAVRIPDVATRRGTRTLARMGTLGAQGIIGHLRAPGSATHEYQGYLRELGLRRQDTTTLVGESGLEAARYAGMKHIHDLVRQAAAPLPTRADDVAVRLDKIKPGERLPLQVQKYLGDPQEMLNATPAEKANLFEQARSHLFMNPSTLSPTDAAEFQRLHAQGKIGFVPKGMLGELGQPHAPLRAVGGGAAKLARGADAINNAQRFAILYLKPAYAIPNLLGNAALGLVQQGFAAPRNLAQAARLVQRLPAEDYARIDAHMGEGMSRAISAHGEGWLSRATDIGAGLWSRAVDQPFRQASFLHEARQAGYRTPAQIHELLVRDPRDPELQRIAIRANRDMIDYSNLGPTEREIVRRAIFFYPWVKGATVYAGRFVREHPLAAATVGATGQLGQQYSQQAFGPTPSYLQGLIPFGANRAINPASAAVLQTPAQVGQALQGLASGNISQAASAANFYTPALSLALAELERRDPSTGFVYRPGQRGFGHIAADQLFGGLPQVTLYRNLKGAIGGSAPNAKPKLFPQTLSNALGQFFLGGVYPRTIDRARLNQLAAQEQARLRNPR